MNVFKCLFLTASLLLIKTSIAQCSFTASISPSGTTNICGTGSVGLNATPNSNNWAQKINFGGTARTEAVGFSIGNKGYIGTGFDGTFKNDFWEYDPSTNSWAQKANVGGSGRTLAVGFSIGNKGYIGTGGDGNTYLNDFWEYDPIFNAWTQKPAFPGTPRVGATGFSIGSKGYLGTGFDGVNKTDFWEYNPSTNSWLQKANFAGGLVRSNASGFSIGSLGYMGTGFDASSPYNNDFWEYNPAANTWSQKANFGGVARGAANGFSIGSKGYIGNGNNASANNDFWEYDPITNTWAQKSNFGGTPRSNAVGFSIGGKGYIGTGLGGALPYKIDFWEYSPTTTYSWSSGASSQSILATTSGTYNVVLTSVTGCTASASQTVAINPIPIISANNGTICTGESFTIIPSGASTYTVTGGSLTVSPQSSSLYTINGTSAGCSSSTTISVIVAQCTSVKENQHLSSLVNIYPNPSSGKISIEFELSQFAQINIELLDITGRTVKSILTGIFQNSKSANIVHDFTDLLNGLYFVKVKVDDSECMTKILIYR